VCLGGLGRRIRGTDMLWKVCKWVYDRMCFLEIAGLDDSENGNCET
jgi:hypothetical protein